MNELYTANIALSVFAMAIMLFSLRGDISQSKIRNLLCGGLYATIAICALCEWSGVQMDGTPPALIPLHIAVKTIELSLAPLIGLFAGCVIHPCPRKVVHRLLCLAGFHALLVLLSAFTGLIFYVDGQNFYHHGLLYVLYMLAYGGSMVFFLVQIWFACRAYQYTGGTQPMLATLFVLLGLMVQLFLPTVKIDWITISCGALGSGRCQDLLPCIAVILQPLILPKVFVDFLQDVAFLQVRHCRHQNIGNRKEEATPLPQILVVSLVIRNLAGFRRHAVVNYKENDRANKIPNFLVHFFHPPRYFPVSYPFFSICQAFSSIFTYFFCNEKSEYKNTHSTFGVRAFVDITDSHMRRFRSGWRFAASQRCSPCTTSPC